MVAQWDEDDVQTITEVLTDFNTIDEADKSFRSTTYLQTYMKSKRKPTIVDSILEECAFPTTDKKIHKGAPKHQDQEDDRRIHEAWCVVTSSAPQEVSDHSSSTQTQSVRRRSHQ